MFCNSVSAHPPSHLLHATPSYYHTRKESNMQIQSGMDKWKKKKKSLENWSVRLYNFCWKIPHHSQLMKTGSSIHKYEILCLWYIIILIRKWVLYIHVQRGKKGDSFTKMFPIFFWIRISKSRRLTYSVCVHYSLLHTAFCNLFQSFHYKQKIQLLLTHSILSL